MQCPQYNFIVRVQGVVHYHVGIPPRLLVSIRIPHLRMGTVNFSVDSHVRFNGNDDRRCIIRAMIDWRNSVPTSATYECICLAMFDVYFRTDVDIVMTVHRVLSLRFVWKIGSEMIEFTVTEIGSGGYNIATIHMYIAGLPTLSTIWRVSPGRDETV